MNYTIADISKKLNIPTSTLRYYENSAACCHAAEPLWIIS